MTKKIVVWGMFALFLAGCSQNNADLTNDLSVSAFQNFQAKRPFSPNTSVEFHLKNGKKVPFLVAIADTSEERKFGLMYQKSLPLDQGMLFLFDAPQELSFWMKNTLISLDIIFLDEDLEVIQLVRNAFPCKADPCSVYSSDQPAQYVLEINAGLSDKYGIREGSSISSALPN